MNGTKIIFSLTLCFILSTSTFASSGPERSHIPVSMFDWENRIYFLMADRVSQQEVAAVVEDLNFSKPRHRKLNAFRDVELVGASFLMQPVVDELKFDVWNPARQKLAKYVYVDLPENTDPVSVVAALAESPDIEYAGIDQRFLDLSSADCGGTTLVDQSGNFTKTWAMQAMRLNQLWSVARGHTYIGVVDLGVYHNHPELSDFSGTTYLGGNFHRHLAFDVGARFTTSGSGPHPFVGAAVFGEVDEYNAKVVSGQGSGYSDCDALGNSDGYNQLRYVGHGTHVAGIVAGQGANSFGWHGSCRHCPLQIARFSYASSCTYGNQPYTGAPYEANLAGTVLGVTASIAFSIDIGTQIINYSGGSSSYSAGFCASNPSNPMCLAVQYAVDRDVMVFASSGNHAQNSQDWPAADPRVYGVSGIQPGGGFWYSGAGCGSNYGTSSTNGPSFSAPAKGVYSSMYPDMNYNPGSCHEYNDGVLGDGYGFCIGTSMAAPFLSGVAGVVRSINPLAEREAVFQAIRSTTDRAMSGHGYHNQFGWGVPRSDDAAKRILGISNGAQVKNRVTPLFNLYSSIAKDFANTTKPQVALAFANSSVGQYSGYTSSPLVVGYSFKESSNHPAPPQPRADVYLLTTHVSPNQNVIRPLYRMRYMQPYGGNLNNWDTVLVWESEVQVFRSAGYELDGVEGYVYQHCTPDCIPPGGVKLYRAYNSNDDDHAVFPQSRLTAMQGLGFTSSLTLLGYAYPNVDSDGDGLIDGMEYVLGTDPFSQDTNCSGVNDGLLYPPFELPVDDPVLPDMC